MTRVSCLIGRAYTERTILRCALSALVGLMPLIGAAQGSSIRMAEQPFQVKLPFAPAVSQTSTPAASAALITTVVPLKAPDAEWTPTKWDLREADRSLRNAFARWASEAKANVVWQLSEDIPLDAVGQVEPGRSGLAPSALAESRHPSLVEAMVTVAKAFSQAKAPFVIREFDNAILVVPRSEERK